MNFKGDAHLPTLRTYDIDSIEPQTLKGSVFEPHFKFKHSHHWFPIVSFGASDNAGVLTLLLHPESLVNLISQRRGVVVLLLDCYINPTKSIRLHVIIRPWNSSRHEWQRGRGAVKQKETRSLQIVVARSRSSYTSKYNQKQGKERTKRGQWCSRLVEVY